MAAGGTLTNGRRFARARRGALAACFALAAAAATAQAQVQLRDDRGRDVTLPAPPARIVSLVPSLTESVCALQACDRLVGTDRASNWPESVRALPKLGGLEDLAIERLVKLAPDVVLAAKSQRLVERLEALGVTVVVLEAQSHTDVQRALRAIAKLLDRPAAAEQAWRAIEADLDLAASRVPASLRDRSVYFEVASAPYAAGRASFVGETLARLGLDNVIGTGQGPFPQLNPEHVVRARPYVVMVAARDARGLRERPGWAALPAIDSGRICAFEPPQWDVLVRPGPRIGEAALVIADCLAALPPESQR